MNRPLLVLFTGVVVTFAPGCGSKPNEGAVPETGGSIPTSRTDPKGGPIIPVGPTRIQAADPNAPVGQDAYFDKLPPGAVLRLGTEVGKPARGWGGTLLFTDGKRLFATHGYRPATRHSYQHYTIYELDGLKPIGEPIQAECNPGGGIGRPAAISADGRRMAAVNVSHLDVYDLATGKRLLHVPRPERSGGSVALSANGNLLAVGGSTDRYGSGKVPVVCTVWDVGSNKEVAKVTVLQNMSADVELSPDGKTLVTRGTHNDPAAYSRPDYPEKLTQIWDVPGGKELARVTWPKNRHPLVFRPDSRMAVLMDFDSPDVRLIDPRTGNLVRTLTSTRASVRGATFTPDGTVLAVTTAQETTRWSVASGIILGTSPRPADLPAGVSASQIAFDGPNRLVAIGVKGKTLVAWEILSGKLLTPAAAGHSNAVSSVAFTADGNEIRSGGLDGDVCRWDAATGRLLGQVGLKKPADSGELSVILSADGRRAATPTAVHDAATGKQLGEFLTALKPDGYTTARFPTPNGSEVMVIGPTYTDKPVRCVVYDADAGKTTAEVGLPNKCFRYYAGRSSGRKQLLTAISPPPAMGSNKYSAVVAAWELTTGKKLGEVNLPEVGGVMGLAAAGDRLAVVGTGYGRLFVVDPAAGTTVREIPDPDRVACEALTVSPDGKSVAVCQTVRGKPFKLIRVYDLATGTVRHTITYSNLLVSSAVMANSHHPPELMAFSPDGKRLATPVDTSVLVWDLTRVGPSGPAE